MRRRSGSDSIVLLLGAALCLALVPGPCFSAGLYNPHAFMADERGCANCHRKIPAEGAGEDFVKEVEYLCGDCHSGKEKVFHPMDIRPRIFSASPLPLDDNGRMDCVTCHDPHSEPYAEIAYVRKDLLEWLKGKVFKQRHRTYFLRMANDRGQLCGCCHDPVELSEQLKSFQEPPKRDYRGSAACRSCHETRYLAWSLTCHARTLQDPVAHPEAVRADFAQGGPFGRQGIVRAVGVHWTQRYILDRAGTAMVPTDSWSIQKGGWTEKVLSREQPWREKCAGCHSTGYNPYLDVQVEDGVGCESCHGPGGRHVDSGKARDIVNPARLSGERKDSICASCHTHGHDRTGQFRYPVGYLPGDDLELFFRGLIPRDGQTTETFTNDGTIDDRLRVFQFWTERFLDLDADCEFCSNSPSSGAGRAGAEESDPSLGKYCVTCHSAAESVAGHGLYLGEGKDCYQCHRPLRDPVGWPSVHDHKFAFGPSPIIRAVASSR